MSVSKKKKQNRQAITAWLIKKRDEDGNWYLQHFCVWTERKKDAHVFFRREVAETFVGCYEGASVIDYQVKY